MSVLYIKYSDLTLPQPGNQRLDNISTGVIMKREVDMVQMMGDDMISHIISGQKKRAIILTVERIVSIVIVILLMHHLILGLYVYLNNRKLVQKDYKGARERPT